MIKLSKSVCYAIVALQQLHGTDGKTPVPCRTLAEGGSLPRRYLLQVLGALASHGILISTRGVDGGYQLTRPLAEISLLEVVEAIDGSMQPELPLDLELSVGLSERLLESFGKAISAARDVLSTIMLSEFPIEKD